MDSGRRHSSPVTIPRTDHGRTIAQPQCMPSGQDWTLVGDQGSRNSTQDEHDGSLQANPFHMMLNDDQITQSSHEEVGRENLSSNTTDTGISDPSYTSTSPSADDHPHSPLSSSGTSAPHVYVPRRKARPDVNFRKLSSKLGTEWERLATFLGFEKPDIDRFKYKPGELDDHIFLMLTNWRCQQSSHATAARLAEALEQCGRKDLADGMNECSLQDEDQKVPARHVPNQMYNNLLAKLCDLTEIERRKMVMLIRQDPLTGDGASLEERDGKPPQVSQIVSCLEFNNYLSPNNVWYLMYLLLQLERIDLYEKVWSYAWKRFQKHQTLYLHRYSDIVNNHCVIRYKITGNTEHFGGMLLAEFQSMLAEKFDGEARYINSVGAQKGCIEIYFQMPLEYKEKAVKAAKDEADWLLRKNVMSVEVMGEEVIHLSTYHDDDQLAELSKEMQLLQCIIENDRQGLEQLLIDGACPNYKVGGKWLLQWAVFMDQEGDREEFVRLLLEHGADRDAKDEMNMTAVEEAKLLGRCRKELTFSFKKPAHTYFKAEDKPSSSFIPRLTAESVQMHSFFIFEKRQYACLLCQMVWVDHVWGYLPLSMCKGCKTQYHPIPKAQECPRKRVMCETCNLVFTIWKHPCITKKCRHCHIAVVDCPPFGKTLPRRQEKKLDANEEAATHDASQHSQSTKFMEILSTKVWHGLGAVKNLTLGACL